MPLFRILGGPAPPPPPPTAVTGLGGGGGSTGGSAGSSNASTLDAQAQQPQQQQQQEPLPGGGYPGNRSRYTYPGQRAAMSGAPTSGTVSGPAAAPYVTSTTTTGSGTGAFPPSMSSSSMSSRPGHPASMSSSASATSSGPFLQTAQHPAPFSLSLPMETPRTGSMMMMTSAASSPSLYAPGHQQQQHPHYHPQPQLQHHQHPYSTGTSDGRIRGGSAMGAHAPPSAASSVSTSSSSFGSSLGGGASAPASAANNHAPAAANANANAPPSNHHPQHPNPHSNTVIRGSTVQPGSRVPPPSVPVSTDANHNVTRPGAYQVTRTSSGPSQVYRVTVPQGVRPGAEFTVHAGPRRVRVRCPVASRPGQSLQITLPPEPETHHLQLRMAPLTAASGSNPGGGAVPMSAEVLRVNEQAAASGGTAQSFLVTIPPTIYPGMQFTVNVSGQRFMVTCPPSAGPGMRVRIVPPTLPEEPEAAPKTQVFEVAVPHGVVPGQSFALVANGQRVLVTCPPNVLPGQKIRFQLPVSEVVGSIQLSYESERSGWSRTIRVSDLKFQWVRLDQKDATKKMPAYVDGPFGGKSMKSDGGGSDGGSTAAGVGDAVGSKLAESLSNVDVSSGTVCNFHRSAYVRKITYLEGNDARMRTGTVELVPASEAVVDSRLVVHSRTLLSYSDIASIQGRSLDEKTDWFQAICAKLAPAWEDGHIKIVVRRRHLLLDSVDAIMSLGRDDLRKRWRIEFLGEPGIDAGGLTREWFELVTEAVYDPAFGLWLPSVNNQACVNINPASAISCPDDHLVYFRFLGRVLGRALFDRQTVKGHMVRTLYKHLLGWPVTFEDILTQDEDLYKSLKKLAEMEPEHVACMCLDFTVTEESMGVRQDIDLVENGSEKEVTSENVTEYLEANLKYRLMDRTKPQLTELLLGFFDIIPEPALTVFDANELELILCGLPNIDLEDWRANTLYSGLFKGRNDEVVQWFWDVVATDFDAEMRARLLQFVTGTSGVPSRGFAVLQGNDGNIKKFTVHGVDRQSCVFPRSHTCFNRIDLPLYESRDELRDKLRIAVTMCSVGFDME